MARMPLIQIKNEIFPKKYISGEDSNSTFQQELARIKELPETNAQELADKALQVSQFFNIVYSYLKEGGASVIWAEPTKIQPINIGQPGVGGPPPPPPGTPPPPPPPRKLIAKASTKNTTQDLIEKMKALLNCNLTTSNYDSLNRLIFPFNTARIAFEKDKKIFSEHKSLSITSPSVIEIFKQLFSDLELGRSTPQKIEEAYDNCYDAVIAKNSKVLRDLNNKNIDNIDNLNLDAATQLAQLITAQKERLIKKITELSNGIQLEKNQEDTAFLSEMQKNLNQCNDANTVLSNKEFIENIDKLCLQQLLILKSVSDNNTAQKRHTENAKKQEKSKHSATATIKSVALTKENYLKIKLFVGPGMPPSDLYIEIEQLKNRGGFFKNHLTYKEYQAFVKKTLLKYSHIQEISNLIKNYNLTNPDFCKEFEQTILSLAVTKPGIINLQTIGDLIAEALHLSPTETLVLFDFEARKNNSQEPMKRQLNSKDTTYYQIDKAFLAQSQNNFLASHLQQMLMNGEYISDFFTTQEMQKIINLLGLQDQKLNYNDVNTNQTILIKFIDFLKNDHKVAELIQQNKDHRQIYNICKIEDVLEKITTNIGTDKYKLETTEARPFISKEPPYKLLELPPDKKSARADAEANNKTLQDQYKPIFNQEEAIRSHITGKENIERELINSSSKLMLTEEQARSEIQKQYLTFRSPTYQAVDEEQKTRAEIEQEEKQQFKVIQSIMDAIKQEPTQRNKIITEEQTDRKALINNLIEIIQHAHEDNFNNIKLVFLLNLLKTSNNLLETYKEQIKELTGSKHEITKDNFEKIITDKINKANISEDLTKRILDSQKATPEGFEAFSTAIKTKSDAMIKQLKQNLTTESATILKTLTELDKAKIVNLLPEQSTKQSSSKLNRSNIIKGSMAAMAVLAIGTYYLYKDYYDCEKWYMNLDPTSNSQFEQFSKYCGTKHF